MVEAMVLHDVKPNGYDHICFIQVKGRLVFFTIIKGNVWLNVIGYLALYQFGPLGSYSMQ